MQQIFEQAEIDRQLCSLARGKINGKGGNSAGLYDVVKTKTDRKTNFKGVAYKKENEITICCLGTEILSRKDHGANFETAFKSTPSGQMKQAESFYNNLKEDDRFKNCTFRFAGHSEGGSEAIYLGLKYGCPTTTFNACGVNPKLVEQIGGENAHLVTNFRHPHDPISKLRELPGESYIVPAKQNPFMAKTPFGCVQAHRIANFGDCRGAVAIEDYKKIDPLFIDKIKKVKLTKSDINSMPADLFDIYECEIKLPQACNAAPI